jgi:NADH dehydrogenase
LVDVDLRVPAHPEVFVIGDLAAAHDRSGRPYPQLAPVAVQGGRHVARQIGRLLEGRGTERFRYRDRGTMATIGRNAAVAELPLGLRFRGRVAWLMWLGLHLVMLIGFRNRASVLLNWSWNYLTYDRGARLIVNARPLDRGPRRGPG